MNQIKLQDIVRLLTGERAERFQFERAINLFQFQVWTLFPTREFTESAALTAATKLLEWILDDEFGEQEELRQRTASPFSSVLINLNDRAAEPVNITRNRIPSFRAIYDSILASYGGLPALLNAHRPADLDAELQRRAENSPIVSGLIDYQLRYALTVGGDRKASTRKHAQFFVWWPTREIRGRQGQKVSGKAPSVKTSNKWWKIWKNTAEFLYLTDCASFDQLPALADDDFFANNLLAVANNIDELRRFFGAYAFLREAISPLQKATVEELVPTSVPRVPIEVKPFTSAELETIAAYEENKDLLGNFQPEDDD
jgi:hypothetical protein